MPADPNAPNIDPAAANPAPDPNVAPAPAPIDPAVVAGLEVRMQQTMQQMQADAQARIDAMNDRLETALQAAPPQAPPAAPNYGYEDPNADPATARLNAQVGKIDQTLNQLSSQLVAEREAREAAEEQNRLAQAAHAKTAQFTTTIDQMIEANPYLKENPVAAKQVRTNAVATVRAVAERDPSSPYLSDAQVAALVQQRALEARNVAEADPRVAAAVAAAQKNVNDQAVVAAGGSAPGPGDGAPGKPPEEVQKAHDDRRYAAAATHFGAGNDRFGATN